MSYDIENNIHLKQKRSRSRKVENVLVLQGGGSLGAFGCGVFKAVVKHGIKLDIVSGTSIGAINGAIIAGSKSDHPEKALEDFWLELAESSYNIIPDVLMPSYSYRKGAYLKRVPSSILNAALLGVPKMFLPRWSSWAWRSWWPDSTDAIHPDIEIDDDALFSFMTPWSWTHSYDHSNLAKTLDNYVDYEKLSKSKIADNTTAYDGGSNDCNRDKSSKSSPVIPRFIATAVNVMTSEPIIFDSYKMDISAKHLLASSGYPLYGFPWIELNGGVFAWDGSLLSNTPVREAIDASPRNDKHLFIVENYPRNVDRLPSNRIEVLDRARDIIFSDKTMHDIHYTKQLTLQIDLIEQLYDLLERMQKRSQYARDIADQKQIEEINKLYNEVVGTRGAEILSVNRIARDSIESPHLLKNADFSTTTVRNLIAEGERKATESLEASNREQIQ
jgi:NTE family protein